MGPAGQGNVGGRDRNHGNIFKESGDIPAFLEEICIVLGAVMG